ncbi:hypothetical protein CLI64_16260 [Nostoc sp. CENA543]|uniref:hypothetical protein n=1 Tax=Nostoc sp. CENA543 TaxID=1869241 RepID=UPI000CA3033A|nr:hypothetical protein [Nostoc sp. CENA543]AUT01812.1 hypothetical protein CLI64_16260 [Nostoc sp. CENA543]
MTNPNERETDHQEIRQESYTDANGNTHTHVTRSTSTNNNSYQSGYVHGRNTERRYQQADLAGRDNENTANGLLLGVLLTSLIGLTVGAFWYFNQQNATVDNNAPVETPVPNASATSQPQQTTIIERTREVPVERTREVPVFIPQPSSAPATPQINVTIPPQESRTQTSPNIAPSNPPRVNNGSNTSTQTPATNSTTSPTPQVDSNDSAVGDNN